MRDLIAELHTAAFASLGQMRISEMQLETLAQEFTRNVEFLDPRYGLRVWMKNKQILEGAQGLTVRQKEELGSCLTSAYPFLTRQLERRYGPGTKPRRFDGNKSPHRAFSLARAGTCTHGKYKNGKELEHIVDGKDYGVQGDAHFSCLFSMCLIPDTFQKVADQSFFIRFLLRARSLYLLSTEVGGLEELASVEAQEILQGWGPYAAPATGILKAFVEKSSNWATVQGFREENLNKLIDDRTKWKSYSDTMKDEGYGLAWLQGGLS